MRTVARLGVVSCLLALVGCVDDNVSVYIAHNLAPMVDETSCTYDSSSTTYQLGGELDVSFGGSYEVHPLIHNQLQQRATSGRSETNGVFITEAEVTIEALDGTPISFPGLPNPFRIPVGEEVIPPATSPTSPGVGTITITVLPIDYTASFPIDAGASTTVVVAVKLSGETLGHIDIETGDWSFPLEVCDGCLLECPTDPDAVLSTCNPGQDLPAYDPARCAAL